MKSGNLNFLEPSGPLQACNETALPLPLLLIILMPLPPCFAIIVVLGFKAHGLLYVHAP